MLTCPICNQPVSEREMQEGRCPECMSLMSWQGFETDSNPEEFPSATDSESAPATDPVQEPAPRPEETPPPEPAGREADAEQTAETLDGLPGFTPESNPSEDPIPYVPDDSASLEDTSSDTADGFSADADQEVAPPAKDPSIAANRSLGLENTLQSYLHNSLGEDNNIVQTIAPRDLSAEELDRIDGEWNTKTHPGDDIQASLGPGTTPPGSKSSLVVKARSVGEFHESQRDGNDYQMMEALGQGGVGVVYSARQASIDRTVALKMLHPRLAQKPEYRNKFLAEAVVIGDLDHPQIVPIYDLGKTAGDELFYTMKRVEGTPWSEKIDKLTLEENLEILLKICDAIAFAHFRGVIHRDLKPDNVMLGDFGEVLVMDWGLALVTEESSKRATIEDSAGLGGTPAYMAPEMVSGPVEAITHLSDIYLLGALLFRILTGKTPHHGKNVKACVKAAAKNLLQATEVRGELIEIALKAMATRPEDRYGTALEFRDALKSYEAHAESLKLAAQAEKDLARAEESGDYQLFARSVFGFEEALALWRANAAAREGQVRAREGYARAALSNADFDLGLSVLDREEASHQPLVRKLEAGQHDRDTRQRQLRRTKLVFRWATLSFVLLLSFACVVIYAKMRGEQQAKNDLIEKQQELDLNQRTLADNQDQLNNKNQLLNRANMKLVDEQARLKEAKTSAERAERVAKNNRQLAEAQTYLAQIALAAKKIEDNRFDEAREILSAYEGSHLVGWEWGHLRDLCNLAAADLKLETVLQDVSCSPDGTLFAVAGDDGLVRVWKAQDFHDLQKHQPAPLWADAPSRGSASAITSVRFSPDRELLAAGDGRGNVSLLKVSANSDIERLLELPHPWDSQAPISSLRFSYGDPQSESGRQTRWLLVGCENGEAAVWNVEAAAWLQFPRGLTLRGHRRPVRDIAASPDRRFILTAGEDDKIQIWSKDEGDLTQPVSTAIAPGPSQDIEPYTIVKTVYWMHDGAVLCLDTIADDQGNLLIVSGGRDGSIQLWNIEDIPEEDRLTSVPPRTTVTGPANNASVQDVRFFRWKSAGRSDSDLYLLTCGDDRTVQLWAVNAPMQLTDNTASASIRTDHDAAPATLIHRFRGHGSRVNACDLLTFDEGGDRAVPSDPLIVSVGDDHRVMLWNAADHTEQDIFELETDAQILDATFDHDSDQIASVTSKGVLSLTDLNSNRSTRAIERELPSESWKEGHDFLANRGQFVPALPGQPERWFVSAGIDGKVIVWDLDRGVSVKEYDQSGRTSLIALSPDRKRIVTGGRGSSAWLGDLPRAIAGPSSSETDARMIELSGHTDVVTAACFSADGRWILTGDKLGGLRVWRNAFPNNAAEQTESVFSIRAHSEEVTEILSFDQSIITTSRDYAVKIWKLSESGEVTPAGRLRGTGEITEASLAPGGRYLACVRRQYETREAEEDSESPSNVQLKMTSEITVYDLDSNPPQEWTLPKEDSLILTTEFFHNEKWLLLTENNGKVWLWDWGAGQEKLLRFGKDIENYCTRVDAGGQRLVTTGGRQVQLWSFDRKRQEVSSLQAALAPDRLLGPHYRISRVSFSLDDSWIVTGDHSGNVKLWQKAAGDSDYTLQYRLPIRTDRSIVAARFSPRSPQMLLTAWEDLVILWTYDGKQWTKQTPKSFAEGPGISYAEFSPSGAKLLVGRRDGTCEVWNAADLSRDVPMRGTIRHQQPINCGAFSNDERLIATGSDDKNARGILWKFDGGEWSPVARIAGHSEGITSVAFSPIHQLRLLTGSRDATAKLWDISHWSASGTGRSVGTPLSDATIKELLTLRGHDKEVTAVDFDHTGQYLLTASRDGKTIRWSSAPVDPAIFARSDSLDLQPDQPEHLGGRFEMLDPVVPALEGGILSLTVGPVSGGTESGADLSIRLQKGDFRLEKPADGNQAELFLQSQGADSSRRKIGTLIQGAVSETELNLPLELQIEPGTTHFELTSFLNRLICTPTIPDDRSGPIELLLTLGLQLPDSGDNSKQEASITLRIELPENETEVTEAVEAE